MVFSDLLWHFLAFSGLALSGLISPYRTLSGHDEVQNDIKWPKNALNGLFCHFLDLPYLALSVLIGPYLVLIKSNMA